MGLRERNRGKNYERELTRYFTSEGYECHRSAQYCGNSGEAADVVGLPGIHIEAKRQEALRLQDWIDQAEHDAKEAGKGDKPVVIFRRNNRPSYVVMRLEDWMELYREWEVSRCNNGK